MLQSANKLQSTNISVLFTNSGRKLDTIRDVHADE